MPSPTTRSSSTVCDRHLLCVLASHAVTPLVSGHGTNVDDVHGDEHDGKDEGEP
jgi:hypothetical protein